MVNDEPSVRITLAQIYQKVEATDSKVDKLAATVGEMVAINRRLDQHHERLGTHSTRISTLETAQAITAATKRPRAPWYTVVGAVVGILAATGSLFAILAYLGQIVTALNP